MTIDLEQLREEIIDEATEDYVGLYEIISSLNSKYPEGASSDKVAAGRSIIQDLLTNEGIALYEAIWPSNHFRRIDSEEALSRIMSDGAWLPPADGTYLSCLGTNHNALNSER